jgi:hypothetical protein
MKTLFFLLFISIQSFAAQRDSALMKLNVFGPGEKFRYKIIYKIKEVWVSAGYVDFEVESRNINKKEYWQLDVKAKTMPAFDIFYKVRDHYISVIDPVTLLPAIFIRDVNEGGYKIFNKYEFNHDSLRVKSETEDSKNPLAEDNYTFLKNTQDLVSCLYYARNINVEGVDSGKIFPINLFLDNKNYKVGLRYLGREKVITEMGEVNCIVGQPLLLEGRVFEETEQMRIYVTDDARRIPIMIESPLKVGKIMAQLIEAK